MNSSIRQAVRSTGNDYAAEARGFGERTGQRLTRVSGGEARGTVSVVIASYNGHRTLSATLACLERQRYRRFEVVVVDDGSTKPIEGLVRDAGLGVPVTLVQMPRNGGLSRARNAGIQCAGGESLVFLDDDMLVSPDLTGSLTLRQDNTEGCVFVGFREDIEPELFFAPDGAEPDLEGDWRVHSSADAAEYALLAADQEAPRTDRSDFRLVEESGQFREFGHGRVIGFWDLPCMVSGHSICVKRADAVAAGGFVEDRFSGWGVEDLAFGALMVARGHFVVPALDWASFHLRHEGRQVPRALEREQMLRNFQRYLEYIREPVAEQCLPKHRMRGVAGPAGLEVCEVVS